MNAQPNFMVKICFHLAEKNLSRFADLPANWLIPLLCSFSHFSGAFTGISGVALTVQELEAKNDVLKDPEY